MLYVMLDARYFLRIEITQLHSIVSAFFLRQAKDNFFSFYLFRDRDVSTFISDFNWFHKSNYIVLIIVFFKSNLM